MYYKISRPVIMFCFPDWCDKNSVYLEDVSSYTFSSRYTNVALLLGVPKAAAFVSFNVLLIKKGELLPSVLSVFHIGTGVYKRTDINSLIARLGTSKVIRVYRRHSRIFYSQNYAMKPLQRHFMSQNFHTNYADGD
jgi:hypothetical protein